MTTGPWTAVTASVRGASHVRSGKPNQDAIDAMVTASGALIAVADGHGSAICVRSDRGAKFAVRTTLESMAGLLEEGDQAHTFHDLNRLITEDIPGILVERWRALVDNDLRNDPLTEDERLRSNAASAARGGAARGSNGNPAAVSSSGARGSPTIETRPRLAYGTTLLAAMATRHHLALAQLGDGDMVIVSTAGQIARPLPADPRLMANETTSMSGDAAPDNFRTVVIPLDSHPTNLVLLATDGYANSYADDQLFFRVVADISGNVDRVGLSRVGDELPTWLREATDRGSGDDISTGLLHPGETRDTNGT